VYIVFYITYELAIAAPISLISIEASRSTNSCHKGIEIIVEAIILQAVDPRVRSAFACAQQPPLGFAVGFTIPDRI
jgi:hypothetical protein